MVLRRYLKIVLESLAVPDSLECHPGRMLIIGFEYATIGLFLALLVFGDYASISSIFLTSMPLIVVMYNAIKYEEGKDLEICGEYLLIKEHMKAVKLFVYLFFGMFIAYSFWFTFLPENVSEKIFSTQLETIQAVRSSFNQEVSGNAILEYTGSSVSGLTEMRVIIVKNLGVLGFCILFSFLYGSGAIYILTWNASVIGVAAGELIRATLREFAGMSGIEMLVNYFTVFPISIVYLVHGIPEVTAYFIGALSGGIISVAVANHHYASKEFKRIVLDSMDLLILAILVLVAAAFMEVYITPIIL